MGKDFFPKIREMCFSSSMTDGKLEVLQPSSWTQRSFPPLQDLPLTGLETNLAIQDAGWRGTALWCRNTPGGNADYRLESLSQSAGINYWKVDIGDPTFNLVRLRDETHIPLTLEHVHGEWPVNGNWETMDGLARKPGVLNEWKSCSIQMSIGRMT